jgi:hypothetical protein
MSRQKSAVCRVRKNIHLLPENALYIESLASSKGVYESSIVDEAIALLRSKDASLSSVA